jgi:hypothetical protein
VVLFQDLYDLRKRFILHEQSLRISRLFLFAYPYILILTSLCFPASLGGALNYIVVKMPIGLIYDHGSEFQGFYAKGKGYFT